MVHYGDQGRATGDSVLQMRSTDAQHISQELVCRPSCTLVREAIPRCLTTDRFSVYGTGT